MSSRSTICVLDLPRRGRRKQTEKTRKENYAEYSSYMHASYLPIPSVIMAPIYVRTWDFFWKQ